MDGLRFESSVSILQLTFQHFGLGFVPDMYLKYAPKGEMLQGSKTGQYFVDKYQSSLYSGMYIGSVERVS